MTRSTAFLLSAILALADAAPQLPFPLPFGSLNLVGTQERTATRPGAVKKAFVYGPFDLKGKDVNTMIFLSL
jgi:hypothetical protein